MTHFNFSIKKYTLQGIMLLILVFTLAGVTINNSYADTNSHPALFFTALNDIPAMDGLIELEDYTLVYDKPEGRIIEMVTRLEQASINSVRTYYKTTLPELGWRVVNDTLYARGAENLKITFESKDGQDYARFTVQPQ